MVDRRRIGDLDLLSVSDGLLKTSVDLVQDCPRAEAIRLAGAAEDGSLGISVNCFVFRRGAATILVDAGAADTMQPTLGRLPAALAAAGVEPSAITHVVLTHLHPDHANGLVDGAGRATFPGAKVVVSAPEHAFWTGPASASDTETVTRMRARNRINLAPYAERLQLVRDGEEVLGCTAIVAAGHSPGHTCWRVETGGPEALLAWGDIVHIAALQVANPDAALAYDMDKAEAKRSRHRMLDMAASERLLVAGAHVDAPGLGRVERRGMGYAMVAA